MIDIGWCETGRIRAFQFRQRFAARVTASLWSRLPRARGGFPRPFAQPCRGAFRDPEFHSRGALASIRWASDRSTELIETISIEEWCGAAPGIRIRVAT